MSQVQHIKVHQGEPKTITVTVEDDAGTAVDITGTTVVWALSQSPGGTAVVTKSAGDIDLTNAVTGKFSFSLAVADTSSRLGLWHHEATVDDDVVVTGDFIIEPSSL